MAKVGRPTKYKPEYCQEAIDFMRQGKSIVQLSAFIDIPVRTIYQWEEDHAEFSHALKRARELSQSAWESKLEDMIFMGKEVNAPLAKLLMANRFGWSDKKEVKQEISAEVSTKKTLDDFYND